MELTMNDPIVVHQDKGSDYGVTVPDLPGCFSAGSTIDEAMEMAREAIELHLEGLIDRGEIVPEPGTIEQYKDVAEFRGGAWALVSVSRSNLRIAAKRINITMPQRVLDAVDHFAKAHNETRSGLLAKAAAAYIGKGQSRKPRATRKAQTKEGKRKTKTRA